MILDRLGIITDEVSDDPEEALKWVSTHQLSHVELRTIHRKNIADLSDEEIEGVLAIVRRWNVPVSCIASPVFKCSLDATRPVSKGDTFGATDEDVAAHYERLRRVIEIAKRFDAKYIRIFSFWREDLPELYTSEIVKHLALVAEIGSKNDVVLLLENEPTCNGGFAEEVAAFARAVNSEALRILWDPGNEVYGGRPAYPNGYEFVKDFVAHVHLKDAAYDPNHGIQGRPIGKGLVHLNKWLHC